MIKKEENYSVLVLLLILLSGFLIFYFLGVSYKDASGLSKSIISILFVVLCIAAYKRNLYSFIFFYISSVFLFLSFCISFGKLYLDTSPIRLPLVFGMWTIFILSLAISLLLLYWFEKSKSKNKYPLMLLVLFVILWIILSINVKFYDDWKMENYLTVPFVLILYFTFKRFKLSNISYTLIFVYMTMHIIGTHYTYSEVPFGFWMQSFFSLSRNHYDRIVHFLFGLLIAYPIREMAIKLGNFKGIWSAYFPIDFVLAFSAIYEIIEMAIAVFFGGDLGVAYLGTQGDVWDAQKDMLMAGLGSLIAMIVTSVTYWYYNSEGFVKELRESLKIKKHRLVGENAIGKFLRIKKDKYAIKIIIIPGFVPSYFSLMIV